MSDSAYTMLADEEADEAGAEVEDDNYDEDYDDNDARWADYYAKRSAEVEEEGTEEPSTDEAEPFDPSATANAYLAADRPGRMEIWLGLSDEQRAALGPAGIVGPVEASPSDDFVVVEPGDPAYGRTMGMATSRVAAGLREVRTGDLDLSEELANELEALVARADLYPNDTMERARALQAADHLLDQARAARREAQPFGWVQKSRQYRGADGKYRVTETDQTGRQRTRVLDTTAMQIEADKAAVAAEPWRYGKVGLGEYMSWPLATRRAYMKADPEGFRSLKEGTSAYLDSLR